MPSLSAYHLTWVSLTLDVGYPFMAAPAKCSCNSLTYTWDSFSWPLPLDLAHGIAPLSHPSEPSVTAAMLQQYMNRELPDVQAGFRKGGGTRDQIANICWIIKKAREFQKNIYLLLY